MGYFLSLGKCVVLGVVPGSAVAKNSQTLQRVKVGCYLLSRSRDRSGWLLLLLGDPQAGFLETCGWTWKSYPWNGEEQHCIHRANPLRVRWLPDMREKDIFLLAHINNLTSLGKEPSFFSPRLCIWWRGELTSWSKEPDSTYSLCLEDSTMCSSFPMHEMRNPSPGKARYAISAFCLCQPRLRHLASS